MITQAEMKYLHESLEKLQHENPTVYRAVTMCNTGQCSFDHAMMWAVIELAKQNKDLQNRLLVELQNKAPTPMVIKS